VSGRKSGRPGGRRLPTRFGILLPLLVILPPCLLPPSSLAAQSPQLAAALRLAQDGRIDSARAILKRMEQSTVPTDTLFPGILYSSALVAPTADDVRRQLQRVIVEYPFSPWAEPAMIALAQLDYANGDPAATGRTLEKFRTDHATSSLYTVAALWGARAGFDVNDPRAACQWVSEGLARAGDNAQVRAELVALARRCSPAAAPAAPDTVRPPTTAAPVSPPRDTVFKLNEIPQPPGPIPVLPRPAPSAGPSVPDAYRVQIVAANTQEVADEMLTQAKKAGFSGIVVKDGGYFKVRLGEYATRAEATAAATKVKAKLGGSPFVVAP
jgi:cell division septation protein DedD